MTVNYARLSRRERLRVDAANHLNQTPPDPNSNRGRKRQFFEGPEPRTKFDEAELDWLQDVVARFHDRAQETNAQKQV